jgi:hypothetical protein
MLGRTTRPLLLGLCLGTASVAGTSTASAQTTDAATAQVLFDDAKRLMLAGKFGEACPKFLASNRLDPKVGTLLNLADCYEKNGQTASAWARFLESTTMAERAGQGERQAFARDRAAALAGKLSKLTIKMSVEARAIPGIQVRRDSLVLDPAVLDIAAPVDPGPHFVEASAPGRKAWAAKVDVGANAAQESVEVPPLAVDEDGQSAKAASGERASGSTQRTLALVAGGVGVVGIGIGSVLGVLAMSKWSDAKAGCDDTGCASTNVSDGESARTLANISTVGFILGALGLAGGAYLWFTAPKTKPSGSAYRWQYAPTAFAGGGASGEPVPGILARGSF